MAKYQEIAMKLIEKLNQGVFNPGDRFYSEMEISKLYKVSSTTAVKVLNTLQEKNRVTRIQGSGTFVAKEAHHRITLFTDMNMAKGESESVKVLGVKQDKQPEILKIMNLSSTRQYLEVHRLRYIGNITSQYSISYLNLNYLNTSNNNLKSFNSIYQRIRDDSGIDPYNLAFYQKNLAQSISNEDITMYFKNIIKDQVFICQYRQTFLPTTTEELLEYAISYKLPQYWGFELDATSHLITF